MQHRSSLHSHIDPDSLTNLNQHYSTPTQRRQFLRLIAMGLAGGSAAISETAGTENRPDSTKPTPPYRGMGMPGPFPGKVVETKSDNVIVQNKVDTAIVRKMMARGMMELTDTSTPLKAWQFFFNSSDVVGIKVNASGLPYCVSSPEVLIEIIRSLHLVGIPSKNIYFYERYTQQLDLVGYFAYVPSDVHVVGLDGGRSEHSGYDKMIYAERSFFGEEETRSYLAKVVSQVFTKIINVPNLKDHSAAGVTGCLKNIAYGSFDNVARSHLIPNTNTRTFIGDLSVIEPLRSKTVLQIMDGLRAVYHCGPFAPNQKYMWYPGSMYFGTDPVAIDRLELEVVEAKRKEVGALSLWDRSTANLVSEEKYCENPGKKLFIREPGHIQYAASLGLGVHQLESIKLNQIKIS